MPPFSHGRDAGRISAHELHRSEFGPWPGPRARSRTDAEGLRAGAVTGDGLHRALVADPVARAGAETPGAVPGVRQPASIEREAAAADAGGQARPQPLELGDVFI